MQIFTGKSLLRCFRKMKGGPEVSISDNPFKDVKDAWYKSSVLYETEENIEDGDVESPDENEGEDINTSD